MITKNFYHTILCINRITKVSYGDYGWDSCVVVVIPFLGERGGGERGLGRGGGGGERGLGRGWGKGFDGWKR